MGENVRNYSIAVTTSNIKVSEAQYPPTVRKLITLTNTSTAGQVITIAFGKEAVAGEGIILYPTGMWNESLDSAFMPSQEEINAISSAIAGSLAIHERLVVL
jgi:hypothetical protein